MTARKRGALLTVSQAAERLNVAPRFVRRLIAERRITFVHIGYHVRIPARVLAEYIDAASVAPAPRWRHLGSAVPASGGGRLLTVDETAELLGTGERFVRRMVAERRIVVVHIGRHVRVPEHHIDTFISAGTVVPVARWHYGKAA